MGVGPSAEPQPASRMSMPIERGDSVPPSEGEGPRETYRCDSGRRCRDAGSYNECRTGDMAVAAYVVTSARPSRPLPTTDL